MIIISGQVCTYARDVAPEFFLATNSDAQQPTPRKDQVWPETGPFISFVSKFPIIAFGKFSNKLGASIHFKCRHSRRTTADRIRETECPFMVSDTICSS
jgi:hypothetical protein